MSSVIAVPELMAVAATNLATIDSSLNAAHAAAATQTLEVLPAAADEVSAGIAELFSAHAQEYQGVAGQAAAFHEQFVAHLDASASSYATAEAASAATLLPAAGIGDPIVRVLNAFLDLLFFPINALLNGLNGLVSYLAYLAFRPFYDLFIAPLVSAIFQAIFKAIFAALFSPFVATPNP
jgi:hypothetical protein